jgi:hypothetical protein
MLASHKCFYCRKNLPTLKGLRSHLTQRKICRDALRRITEKRAPTKKPCEDEDTDMSDIQENDLGAMDDIQPMLFDPPQQQDPSWPNPGSSSSTRDQLPDRRPRVEEVEDEESGTHRRWIKDFPLPAGTRLRPAQSYFETVREDQRKNGDDPWAPFKDEEEWELAQWLITNVGQNATDKYLKLPIVSLFASVSPRSKLKVTLSDT